MRDLFPVNLDSVFKHFRKERLVVQQLPMCVGLLSYEGALPESGQFHRASFPSVFL